MGPFLCFIIIIIIFLLFWFFMLLILWTAVNGRIVYCDVVNVQPRFNFSDEIVK